MLISMLKSKYVDEVKSWWIWAYWLSPLTYAQRAISVNEFSAPRWDKVFFIYIARVCVILHRMEVIQFFLELN